MFDKKLFSKIIKNIKDKYTSQEEFAKASNISRTYLSQYMNLKMDEVPSIKMLEKLANASKGEITFEELLIMCDYIDKEFEPVIYSSSYAHNPYVKNTHLLEDVIMDVTYLYDNMETLAKSYYDRKIILNAFNYIKNNKIYFSYAKTYRKLAELCQNKNKNFIINKDKITKAIKKIVQPPNELYTSNVFPTPTDNKLYMCPVYGRIAAGVPNWAEQCMEGRLPLDPDMMNIHNPEECFFLRVSGESMNKVVKNGGYALIRKQEDVENGDIAVVLVNGYDATLKKFTRKNDMVVLEPMSDDSSFEIQIYDRTTQIKILGKYIGKFELN